MKKIHKTLLIVGSISVVTATSATAFISCGNEKEEKVVLQTSQSKVYPMMIALKELIPLYNQQMKGTEDFLEVELQDSEITKKNTELSLASDISAKLKTGDKNIPNLILNNQAGAYVVNQHGKLLDLSGSKIKNEIFNTEILKTHNSLKGEKIDTNSRVYNIPFNITDVDSLVFNLDIMNKIFELIEQGGGTIDENMELYKRAKQAGADGVGSSLPSTSIFSALKLKTPDAFKDFQKLDWELFSSIRGALEFSKVFFEKVEIDKDKLTSSTLDGQIFSIDYQQDAFFKFLNNENNGESLWELKPSNSGSESSFIDYSKIKNNDKIQKNFKNTWNDFTKNNFQTSKDVNGDLKTFYSVKFENNTSEWASWDIRMYKTAFAYAAAVGVEQSVKSPTSRLFFAPKNDENKLKQWEAENASKVDVWHNKQVTINDSSAVTSKTYLEGGSSLVPIKTSSKRDKATIKFLDWIYNGEVQYNNKKMKVYDFIIRKSGYIIPLKEVAKQSKLEELKNERKDIETKINNLVSKASKSADEVKELTSLETSRNYLDTAIVSLESILEYTQSNSDKYHILHYPIDEKTSKVISDLTQDLLNSTIEKNPSKITPEEALEKLLKNIK